MRTAGTAVVSGCQATRPGTGRRHISEVSLQVCDIQEEVVVVLGGGGSGGEGGQHVPEAHVVPGHCLHSR